MFEPREMGHHQTETDTLSSTFFPFWSRVCSRSIHKCFVALQAEGDHRQAGQVIPWWGDVVVLISLATAIPPSQDRCCAEMGLPGDGVG